VTHIGAGTHTPSSAALVAEARTWPADRRIQVLEAACDQLRRDWETAKRDRNSWQTIAVAREHEIAILRRQLEAAMGVLTPIPSDAGLRLTGRCSEKHCDAELELRKDGLMRIHKHQRRNCAGGRRPPLPGSARPLTEETTRNG
jgi:hypothetical protein